VKTIIFPDVEIKIKNKESDRQEDRKESNIKEETTKGM
jgi:hypothetical protein